MAFLKSKFKQLQNEPHMTNDYIMALDFRLYTLAFVGGEVHHIYPKMFHPRPVLTYHFSGYFGAVADIKVILKNFP